jgi:hypothetical protein
VEIHNEEGDTRKIHPAPKYTERDITKKRDKNGRKRKTDIKRIPY